MVECALSMREAAGSMPAGYTFFFAEFLPGRAKKKRSVANAENRTRPQGGASLCAASSPVVPLHSNWLKTSESEILELCVAYY